MAIHTGSCYCGEIKYTLDLKSNDGARTSLCHCKNCKKFFGGAFGLTTKVSRSGLKIDGKTKEHVADNGTGKNLHREFCPTCGSGILEWAEPKTDFTYIAYGTLDKPGELPPKGEFFCSRREEWMPEIPNVFHKQKIQE